MVVADCSRNLSCCKFYYLIRCKKRKTSLLDISVVGARHLEGGRRSAASLATGLVAGAATGSAFELVATESSVG
jgi:hypothetical protein